MKTTTQEKGFILIVLLLISLLIGSDLWQDFRSGSGAGHILTELVILLLSCIGMFRLMWSTLKIKQTNTRLATDLAKAEQDLHEWKDRARIHLEGLHRLIDDQFEDWSLTGAEKEVGYLLLKGLSFKEIGEVRGTTDRTVRQQSQAIYRKANLCGRSEFSAFFLEDLLNPAG